MLHGATVHVSEEVLPPVTVRWIPALRAACCAKRHAAGAGRRCSRRRRNKALMFHPPAAQPLRDHLRGAVVRCCATHKHRPWKLAPAAAQRQIPEQRRAQSPWRRVGMHEKVQISKQLTGTAGSDMYMRRQGCVECTVC